jgi:hypothetical protein
MKPQNLFALSLLFVLTATGCGKQENEDLVKPTANVTESISVEDAIDNDLNENFGLGVGASASQQCKAKVESARKLGAQAFARASQLESRRQGLLASQSANPNISTAGEIESLTRQIIALLAQQDAYLKIVKKGCK